MAEAAPVYARRFRIKLLIGAENMSLCDTMSKGLGAQGRNRTTDTAIFSRMLYQLSYLGVPLAIDATVGGL